MCGIAGIISKNNDVSVNGTMKQMVHAARHRGKDGEGTYHWNNVTLGHRRLAIIDLSEEANQPMLYRDQYAIVFNGEIFNFIEIRESLKKLGYTFQTRSDTEVILAAYDHWGMECVTRFNGMWSFALLDKEKNLLFCCRDRFGIKPFYYVDDKSGFYFGSEIRQLLAVRQGFKANKGVLFNYLFTGMEEYSADTFFSGIQKLPQSHYLIFDLESTVFEIKRYYEIHLQANSLITEDEWIEKFRETLTDSVRLRLRSDVPVGTCLSGGLDSSSVASIASGLYSGSGGIGRFLAIHGKSIEKSSDESRYAGMVSDHCHLNLIVSENGVDEFRDILPKVIETQEEPFGSPSIVMQYFVMQKACESGAVVMLDGQGGDELLLGYERYFVSWLYAQKGMKKLQNFFKASQNSKLDPFTLLQYYFYFTSAKLRYSMVKSRFKFIRPQILKEFDQSLLREHVMDFRNFETLQQTEIFKYQLPHLLKYEDKNSMAHSIEARLPFLDYRLVELSLSLPVDLKIKSGFSKYILRKSMVNRLPEEILWRKNKFGFNAPVQTWLSDREAIFSTLQDSPILSAITCSSVPRNIDLTILWRLYNIALWERTFDVVLDH